MNQLQGILFLSSGNYYLPTSCCFDWRYLHIYHLAAAAGLSLSLVWMQHSNVQGQADVTD